MGLFSSNYSKPGPGVAPNAPRKKGAARFFEVLGRDFFSFYRAGALALLSALPYALGLWFSIETHSLLPLLITGIVGGMLAAPQLCALDDTILRSLRDEPGYWWVTYKRAWKQNAKASLLPGAICGLMLAMQVFTVFHIELATGVFNAVVLLLSFLLLSGLSQYMFVQIPLLDLSFGGLLKNTVMLFLGYLPRTGLCVLFQVIYWGVVALLWPLSGVIVLLGTIWLPALLSIMAVYEPLNKSFRMEEKINAMREEKFQANAAKNRLAPEQQAEPETTTPQ